MDEKTQQKLENQKTLFSNRLKRKIKELKKWTRKNKISCYRIYDRDIPEIPVSLDLYEFLPDHIQNKIEAAKYTSFVAERISQNDPTVQGELVLNTYAVIYLYERPYEKDENEEEFWFDQMAKTAAEVLNIPFSHIVKKERKRQRGTNQYEKDEEKESIYSIKGLTQECGELFNIDLTSYLDTGLFFDHRPLRSIVRETASKKSVLNLFCYTGSFSVYAAEGGAKKVESVDLSNTYLSWAEENLKLNGFRSKEKLQFTKADVISWLEKKSESIQEDKKFDLIILDPPTFSNSKSTQNVLDINRDWPSLVANAVKLLNPNGILYFSTNSTRLTFDPKLLPKNTDWKDLTQESIPKDYEGTKCHRLWKIQLF